MARKPTEKKRNDQKEKKELGGGTKKSEEGQDGGKEETKEGEDSQEGSTHLIDMSQLKCDKHLVRHIFHFMRAISGLGVLVVPFAFTQTGMVTGVVFVVVVCALIIYNASVMAEAKYCAIQILCAHEIATYREYRRSTSNIELTTRIAEMRFRLSREMTLRHMASIALGRTGSFFLELMIIINQMGIATAYNIMLANAVYYTIFSNPEYIDLPEELHENRTLEEQLALEFDVNKANPIFLDLVSAIPLPFCLIFCYFHRKLAYSALSIFSVGSLIITVLTIFVYTFVVFQLGDFEMSRGRETFIGFAAIFSGFELMPIVVHLENAMSAEFEKFNPYILLIVVVFGSLVLLFGFVEYLAFGRIAAQLISVNFETGAVVYVINGFLIFVALISYPVSIHPVLRYLETRLFSIGSLLGPKEDEVPLPVSAPPGTDANKTKEEKDEEAKENRRNEEKFLHVRPCAIIKTLELDNEIPESVSAMKLLLLRFGVTAITLILSVVMKDYLGYFMALIGAATSIPLNCIVPAFLHLALDRKAGISYKMMILNSASILLGIIMATGGFIVTVEEISLRRKI